VPLPRSPRIKPKKSTTCTEKKKEKSGVVGKNVWLGQREIKEKPWTIYASRYEKRKRDNEWKKGSEQWSDEDGTKMKGGGKYETASIPSFMPQGKGEGSGKRGEDSRLRVRRAVQRCPQSKSTKKLNTTERIILGQL